MLLPVAAGLLGTALPAWGLTSILPDTGVAAWRALLAWPGLSRALALTVTTGVGATAASFAAALAMAIVSRRLTVLRGVQTVIAPLLAVPHAALAIGLAFVIAPSGWIARLVSPWLTGWRFPPDIASVQDPYGGALMLALWIKETPYLLLMILAALAQAEAEPSLRVAASLGYGPWRAWILVVWPRVWSQVRLPVLAVLVFSLSVVDVSLVLGPGTPPPLAVQAVRWFADPDLSRWPVGCAATVLLCGVVAAIAGALLLVSRLTGAAIRALAAPGERGGTGTLADATTLATGGSLVALGAASIAMLAIWSVTAVWRFPAALPARWSLATWAAQASALRAPAAATLSIGGIATLLAIVLCVGCLENERRTAFRPRMSTLWLLYVPLLVPQVAFLFGLQMLLVWLRLDGTWGAVIWAHLVFVMPYVFLTLADPWRALDPRLARSALGLGVPPWRVLLRVTLPLLARPLLGAAAVGFAVSAGLYLPTLFAGAGRIDTLTTLAVTLSSGGDRRILAATAMAQTALPLLVFVVAVGIPSWRERRRRGLAVAR